MLHFSSWYCTAEKVLICSLTTFENIVVGMLLHKMKLLSKSSVGAGYSICCHHVSEEARKNNKYWECQKFEYQSRSMVLLIIWIFFRAVVMLKTSSFWRRRLLFKRLSSWVWKCLRVCCPSSITKKAIAKKNLEADNENFSFPFYDLMGPPCSMLIVWMLQQWCQRSDRCIGQYWPCLKVTRKKNLDSLSVTFIFLTFRLRFCFPETTITKLYKYSGPDCYTELCVYYHIIVSRVKQGQEYPESWSTKNKQR